MILELAAMIAALAFAVLVGYLVPTVIQLKKTVSQSEQVLARLNAELPLLLKEVKATSENVRSITDKSLHGVEQASTLLSAVGEIGETVRQVHGVVRGRGGVLTIGLASALAGLRAASHAVKHRMSQKGGYHGK